MTRRTLTVAVVLGLMLVAVASTRSIGRASAGMPPHDDRCAERLQTFDTLDFTAFSDQKWNRFSESHASDIVVTWPDGHE